MQSLAVLEFDKKVPGKRMTLDFLPWGDAFGFLGLGVGWSPPGLLLCQTRGNLSGICNRRWLRIHSESLGPVFGPVFGLGYFVYYCAPTHEYPMGGVIHESVNGELQPSAA
jgi:hypothetical protein